MKSLKLRLIGSSVQWSPSSQLQEAKWIIKIFKISRTRSTKLSNSSDVKAVIFHTSPGIKWTNSSQSLKLMMFGGSSIWTLIMESSRSKRSTVKNSSPRSQSSETQSIWNTTRTKSITPKIREIWTTFNLSSTSTNPSIRLNSKQWHATQARNFLFQKESLFSMLDKRDSTNSQENAFWVQLKLLRTLMKTNRCTDQLSLKF